MKCKKCGRNARPGKALKAKVVSADDLGGDAGLPVTTLHEAYDGTLIDCMKCEGCGHSWVPEEGVITIQLEGHYSYLENGEYKTGYFKEGDQLNINTNKAT